MDPIFFELGLLVILAAIMALVVRVLKQPLIPAYILTGFLLTAFGVIKNHDLIISLSELGIAFLLFVVGLEIDVKKLKHVSSVATIGTTLQFALTAGIAFLISKLFHLDTVTSIYLGLIVAFSSTMVVIKLLSDKKQLDTLHGRIIVGILLMQDFLAVLALSLLSGIDNFSIFVFVVAILEGLILFFVVVILTVFVFPPLFKFAAKSQELLFLVALAVCFLFSILFSQIGHFLISILSLLTIVPEYIVHLLEPGFSIAIGAFVAGLSLANLPYGVEIEAKVRSLKDFFSILFFISLGMSLQFENVSQYIGLFILFIILVVVLKPLLITTMCSIFGYKKKPSFLSGLYLGQISEFGLIIALQGLILGHISQSIYSLVILLAVITIALTSYFDKFEFLYHRFQRFFNLIDKIPSTIKEVEYTPEDAKDVEIILFGYNRAGYSVLNKIREMKKRFLVVDYNPEVIRHLADHKIHCIYGDYGDKEVLEQIDFTTVKFVISTPPDYHNNLKLVKYVREQNPKTTIFLTADHPEEALNLYDVGADYVVLPHLIGGEHLSIIMDDTANDKNSTKIIARKLKHIKELHHRKYLGHFSKKNHVRMS